MCIDGCNNTALIISTLFDSGATQSLINKSIIEKTNLTWVLGKKLAVFLADGSVLTCEEEVDAAHEVL